MLSPKRLQIILTFYLLVFSTFVVGNPTTETPKLNDAAASSAESDGVKPSKYLYKIKGADYAVCSDIYDYCTTIREFNVSYDPENPGLCLPYLKIDFKAVNPHNVTKQATAYLWQNGGVTNSAKKFQDSLELRDCRRFKL